MKTFTINNIRSYNPCYDPTKYLPEDWQGTALDILQIKECPAPDRLFVVLREGWIDDKILRLFAIWRARETSKLIVGTNPRSIAACDVAERFAHGDATKEELDAAWDKEELDAVWDAVWDAFRVAQVTQLIKMLEDE